MSSCRAVELSSCRAVELQNTPGKQLSRDSVSLSSYLVWWFRLVNGAKLCGLGKDKGFLAVDGQNQEGIKHPVVYRYIHLESLFIALYLPPFVSSRSSPEPPLSFYYTSKHADVYCRRHWYRLVQR
jgi:hypothetical protein